MSLACADASGDTAFAMRGSARPGAAAAAGPVDSILPVEEATRRFLDGVPAIDTLNHAAPTRDRLVARFVAAIGRSDSAALSAMKVSRAEYGFLYYPSSAYARKPYELAPDIAWMLNSESSDKGMRRLLGRLGGDDTRLMGYECEELPVTEGDNRVWRGCVVTYEAPAPEGVATRRLFGAIVERHGRFKFLSYANDF